MSEERSLKEIQKEWPQTLKLYLSGFAICLVLTALSFLFAGYRIFESGYLIATLVFLAIVQAFVQLIFFMHFGKESKPRWMLLVFYFMVTILVIVVLLSLWIIYDLNNRVMPGM
ncbi:MAG: cytochrome o ubiquinol oxidase subunit IV [Parachlamydiales bacterium]|nr:cytochrome o ubiquinol oxidase subunit IV [Parachlamydiales bacterium]